MLCNICWLLALWGVRQSQAGF